MPLVTYTTETPQLVTPLNIT